MKYDMLNVNNTDPILKIRTDRLQLKTPCLTDAGPMHDSINASFSDIYPWLPWATKDITIEDCENHIKYFIQCHNSERPHCLFFHIWHNVSNNFIGSVYFGQIEWRNPAFSIGYWLDSREVNNGYMREAVNALAHVAFQHFKANRIEISTSKDNFPSRKIPEKLNFDLEAELKSHHINYTTLAISSTLVYACIDFYKLPKSTHSWTTPDNEEHR